MDDTDPAATQSLDPLRAAAAQLAGGFDAPPGVLIALSHEGDTAFGATGVAQAFDDVRPLLAPAPMTLATRSDIGSVTKILATTTAVMALYAAGELTLEHTVGELLAEAATSPAAGATVGQLLEHRAGLWQWWPLYLTAREPERALREILRRPLRHEAGAARHYSDLGFQLLGAIVERVTGEPLRDATQGLALGPFGLSATRYGRPGGGAPVAASSSGDWIEHRMIETGDPYPVLGSAQDFTGWRHHVLVGEVNDGNAFHAFGSVAGHAGLFSSGADLLRYGDELRACLSGGGPLPEATVRRFLTAGTDGSQGLGFRRWSTAAGDAWGHTGFPGVAFAILPEAGATVAMITNRLHTIGTPRATEPMWERALRAACEHLAAA